MIVKNKAAQFLIYFLGYEVFKRDIWINQQQRHHVQSLAQCFVRIIEHQLNQPV